MALLGVIRISLLLVIILLRMSKEPSVRIYLVRARSRVAEPRSAKFPNVRNGKDLKVTNIDQII